MPSHSLPAVLLSLTASRLRTVDSRTAAEVHNFEVTRTAAGLVVYRSVSCGCEASCYVCEGRGLGEEEYTIPDNAETVAWARNELARMSGLGWTVHTLTNGFSPKEVAA